MKRKFKKIYVELVRALVILPKSNEQSSISIEYVEFVLKEIFKDNKSISLSDHLMRKAYTLKDYEKKM